ncbi:MAG: PAS domain-containing protein [Pseudohongiellaceae bacterium]
MNVSEKFNVRGLELRLAEAEATIEALLSGQIDAMIDNESRTPVLLAQAQEAVSRERDRAQRYLDTPEVILLALDLEGRITLINRYACSILGWAAEELLGRNWFDVCSPVDSQHRLKKSFHNLLAGDLAIVENPIVNRAGGERLIEWRNTLLRDEADQVIGTFSCGTDITERRLSEANLRQTTSDLLERTKSLELQTAALHASEERTNYALGAARMGVWELDPVTQRITWSDTMAVVFGLTIEQTPKNFEDFIALVHCDDRQLVQDSLARAAHEGTEFKEEFRVCWPDGTSHWITSQARMRQHDDNAPAHWLGIGTDISDQKALEAQFRQAQKMEAVGQLAGGVAHDFNNLLTVILGYSDIVLGTFEPQDRRRQQLAAIIEAGRRATGLTKQLLAFSRKQVLQPKVIDLNSLVNGMDDMLRRLVGENVDLVSVLANELGSVRADLGQIEQVLMNLVVNARDAMPQGGRLSIETANVELETSSIRDMEIAAGPYVMLAVNDSGSGMSNTTKQHLFEPFFTTKEQGKGTGLGLATVYGIVKQSGGYIWVYTELGEGTTFKIYLPRSYDHDKSEKRTSENESMMVGTETVLVVEDEEAVRLLTRSILETAGYRVFDAAHPILAQALFKEHGNIFNLLVTDVIMPGLSGPKLFETLSAQYPDLKVLFVSGYTDDTIVHQGQLNPDVEFLQKPFTATALRRKVRNILDQ